MPNIELVRTNLDIVIAPFPGTSAEFNVTTEWRPVDRPDVQNQVSIYEEIIQAGHPVAANAANIQSAAQTHLENQFGARGQSLVTSPVSRFTISWGFLHPANFAADGVRLNALGIWMPVEYPNVRPQTESISVNVPGGHDLIPDLQAVSDYVLTLIQNNRPGDAVTEPA